ncbi:MAG: type 1 glutamine amidotransferase [Erysipelotrichaceae bacterium]
MELNICWMYHDIMDLYGDAGNIQTLKIRAQQRGIDVIVDTCGIGEDKDLSAYDVLFIGGGADNEQAKLYEDLLARKANIQKAMEERVFVLLICGGYQLFGQYYLDATGHKTLGLGFFEYYTEASLDGTRCIGNVAVEFEGHKIVGFENHGGQTRNVATPFAKVLAGHGNTYQDRYEGFYNGQVLGTYLHGPLLPKNPEIADLVISKGLAHRYGEVVLQPLDDRLEQRAKQVMLERILK